MIVEQIIRGNEVLFSTTFTDADGDAVIPSSVILDLNYLVDTTRTYRTLIMTVSDGTWSARWDSEEASKGRVYWSIRADNPPAADEGYFELKANPANPDPGSA